MVRRRRRLAEEHRVLVREAPWELRETRSYVAGQVEAPVGAVEDAAYEVLAKSRTIKGRRAVTIHARLDDWHRGRQ